MRPPSRLLIMFRIALAAVFLVAGVFKLADLEAFAVSIGNFGILPDGLVAAAALLLALAEVLAAVLLLLGKPLGLWLITGMLLLFMGVLVYGIQLGLDIDCGCFGAAEGGPPATLSGAFLRDIPLLLICLALLWQRYKSKTVN